MPGAAAFSYAVDDASPALPMDESWRHDIAFSDVDLDAFDLVSFDIFDTLLFRTVSQPSDAFPHVGRALSSAGLLARDLSPHAFGQLRVAAELEARRRRRLVAADGDIRLDEIYALLEAHVVDATRAAEVEVGVECELTRPNPVACSFLAEVRRRNKGIVFLSDMYLSAVQLDRLLAASGVERRSGEQLIVSSETRKPKQSGEAFPLLLERFPGIAAERILHVGDNDIADVSMPRRHGLSTVAYRAIPAPAARWLQYEQLTPASEVWGVQSLRRIAVGQTAGLSEEGAFWFKFGASVIGPFLDAFARWVVRDCALRGSNRVVALMREGHLLAPLLEEAARDASVPLTVVRGWFSRRSTLLARSPVLDVRAVSGWLDQTLSLRELFGVLGVTAVPPGLDAWGDVSCLALPTIDPVSRKPMADVVHEALRADASVAAGVEALLREQHAALRDYLASVLGDGDNVTVVDVGYSGTMQSVMDELALSLGRSRPSHRLAVGGVKLVDRALHGLDVRCFVGALGVEGAATDRLLRSQFFLELLMAGPTGSTRGYARDEQGRAVPVIDVTHCTPDELRAKAFCEQGVLHWAGLVSHSGLARRSGAVETPSAVFELLLRHIELPTEEEARRVGALRYDLGVGSDDAMPLCSPGAEAEARAIGAAEFLARHRASIHVGQVAWPHGVVGRFEPARLLRDQLARVRGGSTWVDLIRVALDIRERDQGPCLVYGAGAVGVQAIEALQLAGVAVSAVIDRNPRYHGSVLNEVPVHPPSDGHRLVFGSVLVAGTTNSAAIVADIRSGILGAAQPFVVYAPFSAGDALLIEPSAAPRE